MSFLEVAFGVAVLAMLVFVIRAARNAPPPKDWMGDD